MPGMDTEYCRQRADRELELAEKAVDIVVARAHRGLAELHATIADRKPSGSGPIIMAQSTQSAL
jgi:hypothetical protein